MFRETVKQVVSRSFNEKAYIVKQSSHAFSIAFGVSQMAEDAGDGKILVQST